MNKNILLYGSIALSLAIAAIIVFSGGGDYEAQYDSLKSNGELSKVLKSGEDKQIEVKYESTKAETPKGQKEAQPPKPKREKFVEAKTLDDSKKFEIAIVNEQNWDENKIASNLAAVSGTIDGNRFSLRVPVNLIKEGGDLKLRVKNMASGETKMLSAPFVKELATIGATNKLTINSSDVSNYHFEKKAGILPVPDDTPPQLPPN